MLLILLIFFHAAMPAPRKLTYYLDFEHPNITYRNPKYYEFLNIKIQRYSRRDPIHYISGHGKTLVDFGNNIKVDGYIYEFLSNEYRPSMIEFHHRICDAFFEKKYDVLKPIYMKYANATMCPFKKGEYHITNISVPDFPLLGTFPFQKGRLFLNQQAAKTGERVVEGFVDVAIKQRFL